MKAGGAVCLGACLAVAPFHAGRAAQIEMVSKPAPGTAQEGGLSSHRGISSEGRFVVFVSEAAHLVPGQVDTSGTPDVFLYDRQTGTNLLVSQSVTSPTTAGNGTSSVPVLSADGRYIAFRSTANDLIAGQIDGNRNAEGDIFLYDRVTGAMTLVSHASASPTTTGNNDSDEPSISADGRFIAYQSTASDLVAGVGDTEIATSDIFLFDRIAGTTTLVSRSASSSSATADSSSTLPALSADGRFVAFMSMASDLVAGQNGGSLKSAVFLFDRIADTMTLVSRASGSSTTEGNGDSGNPAISSDGSYIAFGSRATDLVADQTGGGGNIFLFERATGALRLASGRAGSPTQGAGGSGFSSAISVDGRFVAFESIATDQIPGTVDQNGMSPGIFLFDRATGFLLLVSHAFGSPATTGNQSSSAMAINADGRYVVFNSGATDLIPGLSPQPPGTSTSTYLFDRLTGATRLLTRSLAGSAVPSSTGAPAIDDAGDALALTTSGSLAPEDSAFQDVYLWTGFPVGRSFFTVTPCRLFDSRQSGPALTSGAPRILNAFHRCGIPDTAVSLAVNVTVEQFNGAGHLILHAGDSSAPTASTINFLGHPTQANNVILPLAPGGAFTLTPFVAFNGSVHAILDVTGWFE